MNRNFYLLITGQSFANMGDVLYMISIINLIFVRTGSAAAASLVPFTITSAMFLSSILTPLLFGKISLKWLLTCSQIGKTILIIAFSTGVFFQPDAFGYSWTFLTIGLIAFLDGCANPIRQALVPHYVEAQRLLKANGIGETATQLVQTIMWFIGSLSLLLMSSGELLWIVAGLFLLASILLSMLEDVASSSIEQSKKREQLNKGWKAITSTPVLRQITKMDVLETIASTVWVAAIILVFVNEALNRDERWWGFINGVFIFGLIIGSVFCVKYAPYIRKKFGSMIFWSTLATSFVTLLFSFNHLPGIAMLLSFLIGFFTQLKGIPQQTVIQLSVPKDDLAAVYASLGAIYTGVFGLASLGMGVAADLLGVRAVFVISAGLLGLASMLALKYKSLFAGNPKQEEI